MRGFIYHIFASFIVAFLAAAPVFAQTSFLPGKQTPASETTTSKDFADIMKQAAENGVNVIVVDTNGDLLNAPNATEASALQTADKDAEPQMSGLMKAQKSAVEFRSKFLKRLRSLPGAFEEVDYILRANSPTGEYWAYIEAFLWSLALFAIGYLVEREIYVKRICKNLMDLHLKDEPVGYTEKLPFLIYRFFLRTIGVLISIVIAYIIGATVFGSLQNSAMQFTVTLINLGYAACRMVTLLWRIILAPYLCQYRIPQFSNKDAAALYHWLWVTGTLNICTLVLSIWLFELGLTYDVFALATAILALIVVSSSIALILINRKAISRSIRNGKTHNEVGRLSRLVSTSWAPIAITYLLFAWNDLVYRLVLEIPLSTPLVLSAYAILMSIIVVYGVINYLIERVFHRKAVMEEINSNMQKDEDEAPEGEQASEDTETSAPFEQPLNNFEDLARRVAGILAFVAGLWALISIWNSESDAKTSSVFIERGLDVTVILFIGYIIYHMFRIWIDNKIKDEGGDAVEVQPGDEGGGAGASRLATLLPLFRNFILVIVIVTIGLIALLEMGINVSPLFAGAGVAGIAIGFGAQTLIRDIFSGAFFLVDDAFRKGEYIDVGTVKGTVEKISVRSFQLRHHLGPLHTIPFGEIQVLTNYSRDWVMMKLPLRVTYDTDVEQVRKLIKKLGVELMEDPEIGSNFLQPLKSQGVIEMQDSAMIIRIKFMTKPGDQWTIRKRVFQEIRELFAREGIKFAHREVTVRLAEDHNTQNLTDAQKNAITGAAQIAIANEEQANQAQEKKDDR